ncbi:unnamed protein product [Pleuronectes platessa]|uniref:Uncharacterized protein n=1 Tax=Pleuronectes platessa TaxID=8262 RepID=A0A9N7YI93_PLEPL|nr:unnamed protein product [Pleuronectes platessa]
MSVTIQLCEATHGALLLISFHGSVGFSACAAALLPDPPCHSSEKHLHITPMRGLSHTPEYVCHPIPAKCYQAHKWSKSWGGVSMVKPLRSTDSPPYTGVESVRDVEEVQASSATSPQNVPDVFPIVGNVSDPDNPVAANSYNKLHKPEAYI